MSFETLTNRISYSGNGATTAFSFPYRFLEAGDLKVVLVSSTGAETVKALTTHYTVSGAGNESGGTVTMLTAPAAGETLHIIRNVELTQEKEFTNNGSFPVDQVEEALDKAHMGLVRVNEKVERAIKLKETDTNSVSLELPKVADRASKYLAFDATGGVIASEGTPSGSVPVSSFGATLIDDSDAAAARTTLGMGSSSAIRTLAGFGNSEAFLTAGDMASGAVHSHTEKTTPVSGDEVLLSDSEASYALKRMTYANYLKNLDSNRNLLYNGNFDHWQRGTSITCGNGLTAYGPDRWYAQNLLGTNGVVTMARVSGSNDQSKYGCEFKITTAPTALITNNFYLFQTLPNVDSVKLYNKNASVSVKVKALGNVTGVSIALMYKTSEAKVDTVIGGEGVAVVSTSGFTEALIPLQAVGTSMTKAGVLGIRIRVTAVSSGNIYDLNNGFVVEQAMLVEGTAPTVYRPKFASHIHELQALQHFYRVINSAVGIAATTSVVHIHQQFDPQMRTTPTPVASGVLQVTDIAGSDFNQSAADVATVLGNSTAWGGRYALGNFSGALTAYRTYFLEPDSGQSIGFDAEI